LNITPAERKKELSGIINNFIFVIPKVKSTGYPDPHPHSNRLIKIQNNHHQANQNVQRNHFYTYNTNNGQGVDSYQQRMQNLNDHFLNMLFNQAQLLITKNTHQKAEESSKEKEKGKRGEAEWRKVEELRLDERVEEFDLLHDCKSRMETFFPDKKLLEYDCGKLQKLDELLKELYKGNHRVLIFTQMSKMLDILEIFLSMHNYKYLRLDGTTKIERRQQLIEKFNTDKRIFVFILSTRSGGVGINLTGANTVIFYDSDWNPAMDMQAQDRCHRIGQTKNVTIYRLITKHTIEENILKKANQKRLLDDLVIQGGAFTTEFFKKQMDFKDLFRQNEDENDPNKDNRNKEEGAGSNISNNSGGGQTLTDKELEEALMAAEDETDVMAMKELKKEIIANSDWDNLDTLNDVVTDENPNKGSTSTSTSTNNNSSSSSHLNVSVNNQDEDELEKEDSSAIQTPKLSRLGSVSREGKTEKQKKKT